MRDTIFLFDVDGTLMTFHDRGRIAYRHAFETAIGRSDGLLDFEFAGLTDRGLVRIALERADVTATRDKIETILELYAEKLPDVLSDADFVTHPGVRDTVEHLHTFNNVAIGLGTGNIEQGARLKLSQADPPLNELFSFGGFGSDAEQRDELLATGARRGAERLGATVNECRIVVIGDTPKDVRAGRAIGADVIGVTSGGATRDELTESDPDYIFEHLADDGIRSALTGKK